MDDDGTSPGDPFRMLADNMSDVVSFTDAEGIIRYVSPSVQTVIGFAPETLLGTSGERHVHPDDLPILAERNKRDPLGEWSAEYRVQRKDGSWIWIESLTRAVHDRDGRYIGRMATARDVTARHDAQAAATQSEARWRSLVENAPDYIYTIDREFRILFLNRDAPGRPRDAIIGRRITDWYPAKDVAPVLAELRAVFDEGRPGKYTVEAFSSVGELHVYETRVSPVVTDGEVTSATVVSRDVSQRERLEQALLSEKRLAETILDAQAELGVAIAVVGDDGRLIHINRALERLTGFSRSEIMALPNPVAAVTAPEAASMWAARFAAIARGEPVASRFDSYILHRSGTSIPVEIVSTAVVYLDKSCRLYILRDLTAERASQRQLESARSALSQAEKLAALGTLVSGVAHEARTPMTAMMNASHLLKNRIARGTVSPEAAPLVDSIVESATRLNGFLDELRRFTRSGVDARVRLSLDEPVRDALRLFVQTHPGVPTVDARLAPTQAILTNPARIAQVVINLVQNAVDASPPGAAVRVITESAPEGAVLVVEDDGAGIADEVRPRIFDPLYTTKPDGTGLGLPIVQRIIEEHGGSIEIQSALGKGTRVRITFPVPRA